MLHKSGFVCSLIVMLLVLLASMPVSLVGAQTPVPGATSTEEVAAPVKPDLDAVLAKLQAKAVAEPGLDALAQEIAQQYGTEFGAEYTEAHVFVVSADTAFEDIVMAFQAVFDEAGWQASETATQTAETYSTAAWIDGSNVFLIYYQPVAQDEQMAVLVTVGMLAIPDIQGLQVVDSDVNPVLAAIADQIAKGIAEKTGATTQVKIMTFPSSIAVADVIAFYQDGMAQAGWIPVDAFNQAIEGFSSMGWTQANEMLLLFAGSISKDPTSDNMLLWIAAKLPTTDATVTPRVTPNR